MSKTRLEYKDKASQKFWEVSAAGSTINVKYGRLGTKGQNSVKKMSTPDAAKKEIEKLIKSKLKKGYKKKQKLKYFEKKGNDYFKKLIGIIKQYPALLKRQ